MAHDTDGREHGAAEDRKRHDARRGDAAGKPERLAAPELRGGRRPGAHRLDDPGRIPRRVGFDGRLPSSWADGTHRWDGYLAPEEYPRIVEPENGRIWTANARVVSGDMLATLGDGGYDLAHGRSRFATTLLATDQATEADMLRIQLDDRAVFLERWQQSAAGHAHQRSGGGRPARGELRKYVEDWGGHAAVDSVGFRAVRDVSPAC